MNREALDASGTQFELAVCQQIRTQLGNTRFIHNKALYSPWLKCKTQIDVLAVTDRCVFVIECKNWKNAIKGNLDARVWTGIAANKHNMTVINVYDQNMMHERALQVAYYKEYGVFLPLVPLIVVPDSTEVKSDCECIYHFSQMPRAIKLLCYDREVSLNVGEVTKRLGKVLKEYNEI